MFRVIVNLNEDDLRDEVEAAIDALTKETAMSELDSVETTPGQYAIVELMGHKVVAGLVTKDEQFGQPMLRVDVPATEAYPAYTQHYGVSAIYCITYVSQDVAQRTAAKIRVNPVSVYVPDLVTADQLRDVKEKYQHEIERLRSVRGLPVPQDEDDEGDEEDDEDEQPRSEF